MALSDSDRLLAVVRTQNEIANVGLDLEAVMELVSRRALELTDAAAGVVEIAQGEEMVSRVAAGEAISFVGSRIAKAGSLSGLCVKLGVALHSDDTSQDDRVDHEECERVGAASMICVPLRHREEAVGVLKVYAPDANRFERDDVATLELLSGVIGAHMAHAARYEEEGRHSRFDALTSLGNRRSYEERLKVEAGRAVRYGWPLSLALFDVDGIKTVNDSLGHPAGDTVLRGVAEIIAGGSRSADDAFRIGGDEFALLMPSTIVADAEMVSERLAYKVSQAEFCAHSVGVSWGVAERAGDPKALHVRADMRLIKAKNDLYGRAREKPIGPDHEDEPFSPA